VRRGRLTSCCWPTCHRCASRRTSAAKDNAPTGAAPGRRRSDPEIRVASAVAPRGRTGNVTALNLHLLFLLRWATSTARSPSQGADQYLASAMPTAAVRIARKDEGISGQIKSGWLHPRTVIAGAHSVTSRRDRRRRSAKAAALAGAAPTRAGLQRSPRAPNARREVIRRHAGGVGRKQDRSYASSGDAPDGGREPSSFTYLPARC
jgi:hypothetical protein